MKVVMCMCGNEFVCLVDIIMLYCDGVDLYLIVF